MTRKLVTAVLASVVAIALLELAARQFATGPSVRQAVKYAPSDPNLREITSWFELDIPNQRALYKGVLFETNSMRLRSPERPLAKPASVHRIAIAGDSFAMGEGVLAEQSYAWRVEDELARVRPGRYETINTGYPGLNADRAVRRYGHLGLPYDPDVAVLGFTLNDIEGPRYEKPVEIAKDPYGVRSSRFHLWRLIGPGYVTLREAYWPVAGSYVREIRHNFFDNPAAWEDFTAALERFATINDGRGICSVLFVHTQLVALNAFHPFAGIYSAVARAAEERGLAVIESFPAFLGRDPETLWGGPHDSHPNAEGHRLLADALAKGLAGLPASCW